eukprot:51810-Eustigmatos_ZCMA.PRE.1
MRVPCRCTTCVEGQYHPQAVHTAEEQYDRLGLQRAQEEQYVQSVVAEYIPAPDRRLCQALVSITR